MDANILFTPAHNHTGKAAFLIGISTKDLWDLVTCSLAVEAAKRNLERKFPAALPAFAPLIKKIEITATSLKSPCPIALPDKDIPIFMSAIESNCTHLLTGDLKDFGRFMNQAKKTKGIIIQTMADFLLTV